jgi:mono/diheme cytochrome c family protein
MRIPVLVLICLTTPIVARADEGNDFFEARVRPVLVEHCLGCHGEKKQKGALRLDTKAGWEKGGDTGPAIVPGKPDKSHLILLVRGKPGTPPQMPPDKVLPGRAVADLVKWVEMGAPDPRTGTVTTVQQIDWKAAAKFWAFRPVEAKEPPDSKDPRFTQPIDRFVASKLDAAGLSPVGRADKRTLIRRVTFDLTGLPPTLEEVEAFVADTKPDAYAN